MASYVQTYEWNPYTENYQIGRRRRSGRKGNWAPDYGDDSVIYARLEWQATAYEKVLNAAAALLAEVGPRAFTVVAVAERSGVARTTIYKYFHLKADLLLACREHVARRHSAKLHGKVTAALEETPPKQTGLQPALARVLQVLLTLAADSKEGPDLWLLTAAEGVRSMRPPTPPATWITETPFPPRLVREVARALDQAQDVLPANTDRCALARWLCALWWHAITLKGVYPDAPATGGPGLETAFAWLLKGAAA